VTIRPVRAITSSAAAFAAALLLCATAFAHGGETFLIAEPTHVPPGGGVGVRADLPTSGPVRLSLAGTDGTRRAVGVVDQTDQGHFEVFIQIPTDLPTGQWTLVAEAEGRAIASTIIDVVGTPLGEETGGQGPRDADDPLLVALPSGWRSWPSDPPEATGRRIESPTGEQPDLVPFVSLGAAVIALALLVARTRPRRSVEGPAQRVR
jgi:hypothetical protein